MNSNYIPFTQRDSLGRYYTKESISALLVSQMKAEKVNNIIDLASGEGSLTYAALDRWKNAEAYSLDIESRMSKKVCDNLTHIVTDALVHSFPEMLARHQGNFDVAVCNPPFTLPKWRDDYSKIINEIGADKYISISKYVPAEIIFISQVIRFLKKGGEAGIILPDGIFTARKFIGLRRYLLNEHSITKVIELPRNIFKRTEAKTHILIFNKKIVPHQKIQLHCITKDGELSPPVLIKKEDAIERMDYSYHYNKNEESSTIGMLKNILIFRGKFNSKEITEHIFHTTKFSGNEKCIKFHCNSEEELQPSKLDVIAKPGDILIARVGREFYKKIVFVESGYSYISDCIFLIRASGEDKKKLFDFLCSQEGQEELSRASSGVAAQHITMDALKKIHLVRI
ncbi:MULTISPECIES: HsdM family class I SAM-dependent methyltransferase [Enterobacteriaceae]|uniref:HsdM family class I SAM-dependent methyltransferase n=1 Tax=Enterobacteriaceae TaxID=543 RepID=UPI000E2F722F|nr:MULTISPECIES: N-6 DNA methylase [Enterobacteriaceae]MDK8078168.1 N-6 DNA methylase [Citrobacter freundii]MDK8590854.1 N-6 DNA methylase [Citrobacter freundii]VAC97384.1 type I restriction-modification system, M subunit [Klebsiella aerogenes]HEB0904427.1 SAM-dependent DNA methyltransferase [Citrobacter freundii]HEB0909147.1 SAM-dependent DNA methyltransferase [Citrobacter freundii]